MTIVEEIRKSEADHRTYLNAGVRSPTADLLDRAADLIERLSGLCLESRQYFEIQADHERSPVAADEHYDRVGRIEAALAEVFTTEAGR